MRRVGVLGEGEEFEWDSVLMSGSCEERGVIEEGESPIFGPYMSPISTTSSSAVSLLSDGST